MKTSLRQLTKKLLLLLGSIILVLFFFEIYLRLFNPQIFDIHPQGLYISDKDAGYVLKPHFEGYIERQEFKNKISINSRGLRSRSYTGKKEGVRRIVILGDSFTFGFGVEENETFSYLLEKCLNEDGTGKYEVLNAAVPGYGTADELNFFESRAAEFKPDLVILQFLSDNDFYENRYPAKEWIHVENGWLVSREGSYDSSITFWRRTEFWLKSNLHSAKFFSERLGYLLFKSGLAGDMKSLWGEDFTKEDENLCENILNELAHYTNALGAKLVILFCTGQGVILSKEVPELNSENFISNFASKNKIDIFNIFRLMRGNGENESFYYPMEGHWTPAGHRFVSNTLCGRIINYLKKK